MSITTEITRLQGAKTTLKNKGVELGISLNTDKLDAIATKFDENITNQGSVSATVEEGDTYTIPQGYHNGSGTVSGVAGGGNYTLQSKTVTPTKSEQPITSDAGYYGLSDVTVNPIPDAYQDVSSVTAVAAEVLANKVFVDSDGDVVAGTMTNNGTVTKTLDTTTTSYTVVGGYHSGTGTVSITLEEEEVTPTTAEQEIEPSAGSVLSKVTVAAIPTQYKDTTTATAVAADILVGEKAATSAGVITGTMANNGAVTATIDGLTVSSYTVPAGYHSGLGTVSLTSDIEDALALI